MSTQELKVRFCVRGREFSGECDEYSSGLLVSVSRDKYGVYLRVNDGGDGTRIVEFHRLDRDSALKIQELYPQYF